MEAELWLFENQFAVGFYKPKNYKKLTFFGEWAKSKVPIKAWALGLSASEKNNWSILSAPLGPNPAKLLSCDASDGPQRSPSFFQNRINF